MSVESSIETQAAGKPGRAGGEADKLQVRAVQRAFDLLSCFGPGRPVLSLSEFARETGLAPSTVSRLLTTLESAHFIRRQADGRYGCGARLLQIGLTALQGLSIYDLSERHLRELSERTGETANLGIVNETGQVMYLRQVPSPQAIRHATWLGRTVPLEGTAIGAAIRGEVGPDGFAATRQTLEPDVTAIAAPIRGPTGEVVGAFSVTGPTYRISDGDIARFGRYVAEAAGNASRDLGGS